MKTAYTLIAIAVAANIAAVYFMKRSNGITEPWFTLAMVVANLLTLWGLGRAFAEGAAVGPSVTILTVGVMIGSFGIGVSAGERVTLWQVAGIAMALGGVLVVNLSPK